MLANTVVVTSTSTASAMYGSAMEEEDVAAAAGKGDKKIDETVGNKKNIFLKFNPNLT